MDISRTVARFRNGGGGTIPGIGFPGPSTASVQESRERTRLYAPPRAALRVLGEGSAFGRGLLRAMKESQGGGCMLRQNRS
jgi:hypothetical protein